MLRLVGRRLAKVGVFGLIALLLDAITAIVTALALYWFFDAVRGVAE
jgi:hypothetical protein